MVNRAALIEYYERALNQGELDFPDGVEDWEVWKSFTESLSREESSNFSMVTTAIKKWVGGPESPDVYPLWLAVAELTRNDNFPSGVENPGYFRDLERRVKRTKNGVKIFQNFTLKYLKSKFETGPVLYRSTSKGNLKSKGEEIMGSHRTMESWTLNPEFALSWRGDIILRRKVDLERVLLTYHTVRYLRENEAEYVLMLPRYQPMTKDEVVPKAEFNRRNNAEWALKHLKKD